MENQVEVIETFAGADNEEGIVSTSDRIDEASGTNIGEPVTISGILLVNSQSSPTSSHLAYAHVVPGVCESQLVFNADTDNGIANQKKKSGKLITFQEKNTENLCGANTEGKKDVVKDDSYALPAIPSIAVGNQLYPVSVPQDKFIGNADPILEIKSSKDTILLGEETSCLINHVCDGPPPEILASDSESISIIEAEELCEKNVAKVSGMLCRSSPTSSLLTLAQVPEEHDSQLILDADTVDEIKDQKKSAEEMIIYQGKGAENLCCAHTENKEDSDKNHTCDLPAISSIAIGNQLSSVPLPQDEFIGSTDPMLEINSSEDTIPVEDETSCYKRTSLKDLMCEGPPPEILPSDSESLPNIEVEGPPEKSAINARETQHAVLGQMEVNPVTSETCVVTPGREMKEVGPAIFTTLTKLDGSLSENATDLCEGVQDEKVLKRITLLQKQVEHSLDLYSKRLREDFLSVQKFFEDLNQQDTLLLEMSSQADNLKAIIDTVLQLPESLKSDVLDLLEACFRSGHWLEKSVKTKELADCKQLMSKGYVSLKYDGVSKVKAIINQHLSDRLQSSVEDIPRSNAEDTLCDPYLVTVTYVADPGEFYVVRLCDSGKLDAILTALNENAASYPIPIETTPGQMYAVCNSAVNWFRGVCGKECGRLQVGDQLPEILYEFFMIDQGHHEHIPASSVRLLPSELRNIPPMARECTLNQNFQGTTWSLQTISLFKHMTRKSPMNMKVFKQHGGVLEVDLAQLISFDEGSNIVSVRDALFFSHRPTSTTPSRRKFTPKFSAPKADLLKHFAIIVSSAETPANMYVQILDDEFRRYRLMQDELQTEMANITVSSSSNSQHLEKGFICAVQYLGDWYRCLVEEIYQHNRVLVFYVDTGHRQTVHGSECSNLPETFLDLPSQAVRCVLDGINPLRTMKMDLGRRRHNPWSRETIEFIRGYRNKQGVIIVENWKTGEVGRLGQELTAFVVLYRDGEHVCLNSALSRAGLVYSTKGHRYPEHAAIRSNLSVQRRLSQSTSMDSFGSGTYAASTETSLTPVDKSSSIMDELTVQAPSETDGQDGDRKHFDRLDDASESSHTGRLPISIFQVSSDNHTPISEVASPGNISQKAQTCSVDGASLIGDVSGNAMGSSSESESSNFISSPGENFEITDGNLRVSNLNDFSLATPMGKRASEDNSSSSGQDYTLKTPLTNSSSCMTLNLPGYDVLVPEKVATNSTNKKVRDTYSRGDTDIVGTVGTQPESETSITVSYVWMDSPDAIYFRTADMQAQYEEIRYKMKRHYQKIRAKKNTKFEVGFRCAVYEDSSFWRAEVVCVDDYPKCEVLFVDTGYQRRVVARSIHPLEPSFDEIKRLVLKCSLYGVFCGTANGIWKEDCIKYIHDRLLGAENISIFRRGQGESKYAALPVMCLYLYDVEGGPLQFPGRTQINLNEELVSMGLAQNRPGLLPLSNDVPVARTWKLSEPPKLGSAFWATVTWVNSAGEIYLHDIKSAPAMNEISRWLNEAYNGTEPTEADLHCRQGDLCIAKYKLDQKWHRAIVKKTGDEPEKVTVFFVDYGTLDAVDYRDIRLNIMLEELPTLTICCKLFNIRSTIGDPTDVKWEWPIETLDHLHGLIVDKEFLVLVKGKGPPLPIILKNHKQSSIASYLVEKKMAEFIDPNLNRGKWRKKKWEKK